MSSCASQHRNSVNQQFRDENSESSAYEINHRLLSNAQISAFDNSRTLNSSDGNISRNSTPELVYDLNKSDRVSLRKTDVLPSKLNVESTKGSHTFNNDGFKIIDLSSAGNKTKFGDMRGNAVQGVRQCHSCSEDREVLRRGKRSVVLVPGTPIHVETAVFVDKDLYQHMALNFPADTERELVRVVLAMINAVSQYSAMFRGGGLGSDISLLSKNV
jgi:hypothetical protein